MVVASFYLLGKDPAVSANIHMVEIDITHDFLAAQTYVADSFSIVEPSGVGFQTKDNKSISDLDTLLDAEQPIAVTVDGHAVREVPAPKSAPIVGHHYQVYPDHIRNHQRLFDQLGSTIQHTDMGKTTYLTSDPAVAANMFQESPFWSKLLEGAHPLSPIKNNESGLFICDTDTRAWKLSHKFLPPALSPKAVRKYTPMMQHCAEKSFKVFDHFADNGEAFDAFAYMFKLTSEAVVKLVLNADLNHFETPDTPVSPFAASIIEFLGLAKRVSEKGAWYSHLPFGEPKRLREVQADFFAYCKTQMQKAQEKGGEDLPIAQAAIETESIADYVARAVDEDGNKLPIDVATGSFPIIVGAGFITTATLMSWMLYCVTAFPGVQEKLVQELIDHGVTADTEWTFDTTNELHYLDKFIKEVQRLYNPAFMPTRTALRDQIIPGGFFVPKGAAMTCALYSLHRNSNVWDDPLKFEPDRWDTDKVRSRPAGAYIPFAMGPRSCIGFNFALQEAKTIFAKLIYRYEFRKHGDERVDYDPEITIFRPVSLYIEPTRRTSWPSKSA